MVGTFYILHSPQMDLEYTRSQVLLHRQYYDGLPDSQLILNRFDSIYKAQEPHERSPFIHYNGLNYIYLRQDNDILLLVVTRRNVDSMLMILFLHKFQDLIKYYLCKTDEAKVKEPVKFDKDLIMDNVYFIYELLDECMDMGIIQMTDYNILKEYIKVIPNRPEFHLDAGDYYDDEEEDNVTTGSKKKANKTTQKDLTKIKSTHNQAVKADEIPVEENHINSSILRASSLAINWRPKGISYAKNEIFIDMIENCDFCYDLDNQVILYNEVFGSCVVKCYLSGMPVCVLGFNENKISKISNDGESAVVRIGNQLKLQDVELDNDDVDTENMDNEDEDKGIDNGPDAVDHESTDIVQSDKKHIPFRNIQFHQCVQLDSIYKENLMKFIPPDDKFILMSYHVEQQRQKRKLPLIMIKPMYRVNRTTQKLQIMCILSTNFKKRLHCKNLIVKIPINPLLFKILVDNNHGLKYKTDTGDVSYQVDSSELIWVIGDCRGNNPSVKMMAELSIGYAGFINLELIKTTLHSRHAMKEPEAFVDDNEEAIKELDRYYGVNGSNSSLIEEIQSHLKNIKSFNHIRVSFSIPMLSYTGLRLNYLKVQEDELKYTCFPWVKYVTQSDKTNASMFNSTSKSNSTYKFKIGVSCFEII